MEPDSKKMRAAALIGLVATLTLVASAPTASADPQPPSYCTNGAVEQVECTVIRPVINVITGQCQPINKYHECNLEYDTNMPVVSLIWEACQLVLPIDTS